MDTRAYYRGEDNKEARSGSKEGSNPEVERYAFISSSVSESR